MIGVAPSRRTRWTTASPSMPGRPRSSEDEIRPSLLPSAAPPRRRGPPHPVPVAAEVAATARRVGSSSSTSRIRSRCVISCLALPLSAGTVSSLRARRARSASLPPFRPWPRRGLEPPQAQAEPAAGPRAGRASMRRSARRSRQRLVATPGPPSSTVMATAPRYAARTGGRPRAGRAAPHSRPGSRAPGPGRPSTRSAGRSSASRTVRRPAAAECARPPGQQLASGDSSTSGRVRPTGSGSCRAPSRRGG